MTKLDAVILADDPRADVRIAGLSARERAIRVAKRVGAEQVHVVGGSRDGIVAWRAGRTSPVLVIRADQLVHTPLVAPLVEAAHDGLSAAVGPDDSYGGAFLATGEAAGDALARLARGEPDDAIAAGAGSRVVHGTVARHPIGTPEERRGATRLLLGILNKQQDNAVTRYLYRPVSRPLTRLLVWTPITPNQISYFVGLLVLIGCWLTAHASMNMVIAGTATILGATYIDCCDGEIARLKLLSSRFGAWLDTVVDEFSSVGYMIAIGWHCHQAFGPRYLGDLGFDPWSVGIALGIVTYLWAIYCVYYNIIFAVGSANSQDYVARFEVVPADRPNTVRLRPLVATGRALPPWLATIGTWLLYLVRRDLIAWGSLAFAISHQTHLAFGFLVLGGTVSAFVLTIDHLRLRSLRRSIIRAGQILESPSG
jgi:phosphatidylglycerophosphate synthase